MDFCETARTREEMQSFVGVVSRAHFRKAYLYPLFESGKQKMTMSGKLSSVNQNI